MKKSDFPVLDIDQFTFFSDRREFYASKISGHLKKYKFVLAPHRHSFFFVALTTKGSGKHMIDFNTYDIKPGAIFFMTPGQAHSFKLSKDFDGYIFFHTREFFDLSFTSERVEKYPFFSAVSSTALLQLNSEVTTKRITALFAEIDAEYTRNETMKYQKLVALLCVLYIELARLCETKLKRIPQNVSIVRLRKLEKLIDKNFREIKSSSEYASMMNVSEKHLNRITKSMLNKTLSDLISERIILEAKRMLVHSEYSIAEVAHYLGYLDNAYFSRFFKKKTGETPTVFIEKNR